MKVMFIASNADGHSTLRLEQEITKLQVLALEQSSKSVEFIFLPALAFEDIQSKISQIKPDIIHISAHGDPERLVLSNSLEGPVFLTPEILKAIFSVHDQVRLIYLSACDSSGLAKSLLDIAPITIGTNQPITNFSAREGAITFYRNLIQGRSVKSAFESGRAIIKGLSKDVATDIFCRDEVVDSESHFHTPLRLIARFENTERPGNKLGEYDVELGLIGCPASTSQVIFFTDDESFIYEGADDNDELEFALSSIMRTQSVHGEIWLNYPWTVKGDFRLFACGTTLEGSGSHFSVGTTLCEAIREHHRLTTPLDKPQPLPSQIVAAIEELLENDGSRIAHKFKKVPRPASKEPSKSKKPSKPKTARKSKQ